MGNDSSRSVSHDDRSVLNSLGHGVSPARLMSLRNAVPMLASLEPFSPSIFARMRSPISPLMTYTVPGAANS